jgi:hypothetical protein
MRRYNPLVLISLLPALLGAQRPDTSMVPRELANALVGFNDPFGGRAEIVVGRVPADYVAALVPSNAQVLGGMSIPSARGVASRATTVLTMTQSPDTAFAALQAHLSRAGFRPAPAMEMGGGTGEGFVSLSSPMGRGMPGLMLNYCSDSSSAYGTVVDRSTRGSLVRLMTTGSLRNTICDPERAQMGMRRYMEDRIRLPTLRPPPGTFGGSGGSGSSGDSRESHARYTSGIRAPDMIAHFIPQLEEQGWQLVRRAGDVDITVVTARKTEKGEQLYLVLTDYVWEPRQHEISLRVWR